MQVKTFGLIPGAAAVKPGKAAIFFMCGALSALAIGHAANAEPIPHGAAQGIAEGLWVGSDDQGRPAFGLMTSFKHGKEMQYFFATRNGAGHYLPAYSGLMTLSHGTSGSGAGYGPHGLSTRGMYSERDAANTLSSRFFNAGSGAIEARYTLHYSIDNDVLPGLEQLQGRYARVVRLAGDDGQATSAIAARLAIDKRGVLDGHVPGCALNGYVAIQGPTRNLYRLSLTVRPESPHHNCLDFDNPGDSITLNGLASLAILPGETVPSLVFATNGYRAGYPLMLSGAIPKL